MLAGINDNGMSRRSFLTVSAMAAAAMALDWNKITALEAAMGPKKDYPAVVIGAGLGGICCGAYLAGQGIPVTLVEQHGIPGGYATAFDRSAGKYRFEVSLHGTSIHRSAAARILANLGVLEKLDLVLLPEVYRLKAPGLDICIPQQDPEGCHRGKGRRNPLRWTDILIRRAEQELIPGLSSMIEVKEAAIPLTNWRFPGNPQGAIYGFEQSMDNAFMTRIDNRTPVKGLYLAGAWGNPGGGFGGALRSGERAFEQIMEDWA